MAGVTGLVNPFNESIALKLSTTANGIDAEKMQ